MPIPYYPGPELQSVPIGASKIWEAPVDLLLLPVAPLILGYFLMQHLSSLQKILVSTL